MIGLRKAWSVPGRNETTLIGSGKAEFPGDVTALTQHGNEVQYSCDQRLLFSSRCFAPRGWIISLLQTNKQKKPSGTQGTRASFVDIISAICVKSQKNVCVGGVLIMNWLNSLRDNINLYEVNSDW